jgi:hypothetical protein
MRHHALRRLPSARVERGRKALQLQRLPPSLSRPSDGRIRHTLKTPYRGTTHVMFEPLDFLTRLAALVPNPGVNLRRYHGVFAPHHALRGLIACRTASRGYRPR